MRHSGALSCSVCPERAEHTADVNGVSWLLCDTCARMLGVA